MVQIVIPPEALPDVVEDRIGYVFDRVSSIVETSSKYGRDLVKEYISTRPSAKSGKRGRIETGDMLRSARVRKMTRSRSETAYWFGMRGGPKYATYQEHGFTHNRSGEWIEGMFAVTDAREAVFQDIVSAIKAIR